MKQKSKAFWQKVWDIAFCVFLFLLFFLSLWLICTPLESCEDSGIYDNPRSDSLVYVIRINSDGLPYNTKNN